AEAISPERLETLRNPQVLLSPDATAAVRQGFAALGAPGLALFDQFMTAVRLSLAEAVTSLFAVGCAVMVLGLIVTLFLEEVPLRKRGQVDETIAEQPMTAELATDLAEVGEL